MASASRMQRMAAVIAPKNSAANAVLHNASKPPTHLPYIKITYLSKGGKSYTAIQFTAIIFDISNMMINSLLESLNYLQKVHHFMKTKCRFTPYYVNCML
jgi:uncharacterized protein (DUF169 family)